MQILKFNSKKTIGDFLSSGDLQSALMARSIRILNTKYEYLIISCERAHLLSVYHELISTRRDDASTDDDLMLYEVTKKTIPLINVGSRMIAE